MDKRIFAVGIILVILGFALAASAANPQSLVTESTPQNLELFPNSILYSSVSLNQSSFIYLMYYSNSTPINFYFVNSSAFAILESNITAEKLPSNVIQTLQGKGLLLASQNSTRGGFPYTNSTGSSLPTYVANVSAILPQGNYYMIYQNPGSTPTTATYQYVLPSPGVLNGQSPEISKISSYGIGSALLLIAGIVLMVYSFFTKPNSKQAAITREAEIAEVYKKIDEKQEKKTGKSSPSKRKKQARR